MGARHRGNGYGNGSVINENENDSGRFLEVESWSFGNRRRGVFYARVCPVYAYK